MRPSTAGRAARGRAVHRSLLCASPREATTRPAVGAPRSVGKKTFTPPSVTHFAGRSVSLPPSRRVLHPTGQRIGGPSAAQAAGANRHEVWRSADVYAGPTANPVGAKQWNGWRKDGSHAGMPA